jgi:hypothetical protein
LIHVVGLGYRPDMQSPFRRFAPLAVALLAFVVLMVWLTSPREIPPPEPVAPAAAKPAAPAPAQAEAAAKAEPAAAAPGVAEAPAALTEPEVPPGEEDPAAYEGLVSDESDAIAQAWSSVDWDAVRQAMPDNLYFQLSVPTTDEAVMEERRRERDRWNEQYGKILSGTASEEEIRAYYDHRARLSTDYVEFATYLLDQYGDQLHERDIGMLELARKLNLARLEEVPRKVEEAYERKRQQDEARAAWLADQKAFE